MMIAEIPVKTLQNEVNLLASLQDVPQASSDVHYFLLGAMSTLAWLGGAPVSPSIQAQMLLHLPEVCQ